MCFIERFSNNKNSRKLGRVLHHNEYSAWIFVGSDGIKSTKSTTDSIDLVILYGFSIKYDRKGGRMHQKLATLYG